MDGTTELCSALLLLSAAQTVSLPFCEICHRRGSRGSSQMVVDVGLVEKSSFCRRSGRCAVQNLEWPVFSRRSCSLRAIAISDVRSLPFSVPFICRFTLSVFAFLLLAWFYVNHPTRGSSRPLETHACEMHSGLCVLAHIRHFRDALKL